MSTSEHDGCESSNNISIVAPQAQHTFEARRQSIAKLSSPLHNTPASISQLSAIYRDRNGSNSTSGADTNIIQSQNRHSPLTNGGSNTPSSRRFVLPHPADASHANPSSSAVEFDEDFTDSAVSPARSYGSFVDDPTILKNVSKHLPTDAQNALKLPSGDMTRDLYQISNPTSLRRSKSMSGNEFLDERRGSTASQLRLPGGFRRDFIQMKKQRFGYTLSKPTFLTKNFLEFLTIYGHFAGEDLEDEDFLACDYDTSNDKTDEESPLLTQSQSQNLPNQKLSAQDSHKTSSIKAFFLLIKAFIGTGVLFLPKAFSNGGLAFSIGLLFFFSVLSYYCYLALAQATTKTGIASFAELGKALYGEKFKILILVSIVITQIGFVAAYTVFTAENLRAFVKNTLNINLPLYYFVIFETLCFAPMSLIRNITKLSLAALLANIFILSGIGTIIFYTTRDLIENGPADVILFNGNDWSLFIGVAIFAFEGIGLILPVQQSMRKPEDFPKVLLAVIIVCCSLFIGIGWLCYATYGDKVQTVVILNLPQDSYAVISIQFFYALAIMLSVPLQLLPAIKLMESRLFKRRESGRINNKTKWYKNAFRILITLTTSTIAYFGSTNLDLFVSFIGCFACIPLVYMYPPMLHFRSVANTSFVKTLDIILVILGAIAMLYTTLLLVI